MAPSTTQRTAKSLTPESFACLLANLGTDSRQAGSRYELLRQRLILFFTRRSIASSDDLADEVIDRLARRLTEGEQLASIEAYALGIARHVAHEQNAVSIREVTLPDTFPRNSSPLHTTTKDELFHKEAQLDAMERSLERLPKEDIQLLTGYYLADPKEKIEGRRRIATKLGLTQAALRKRIFVLCRRLRTMIDQETN